jgi:nitrogen fixation protein NifZ
MGDISRDSATIEIDHPPRFDYGEKVRSRFTVRNDGTFRGKDIGEVLVKKGDIGYVASIGTFLQQYYIYGVDFVERGYRVGMKGRELDSLDQSEDDETGEGGSDGTA